MNNTTANEFYTTKKERGAYGSWFVGQNIIYFMVVTYLANFLTDEVGLAAGAVATLILIARLWDAINDPMLGSLVDASHPKKGKFKPWVNAVTLIMPIITIFVFWNFNGSDGFNLVYAYISYIIWGMVYTVSDVPIFALATTMSDNPDERVVIMSIGRLAGGLASIVIGIAGAQFIANFGYQTSIIVLMIAATIFMIPLRFLVKERVVTPKPTERVSLKSMIKTIFGNKYLLIFYASFIAISATMTSLTIGPYFAKWNLGDIGLQSLLMGVVVPIMLALPALTPWLVKKFGKRKIFIYGMASSIVFSLIQYIVGYENLAVFLVLQFLKSAGMFAPLLMMGIFTADIVEYGAYTTGVRKEATNFSIQTFSTKLGSGVSAALSLWIISAYGYDGNAASQTTRALEGIWITNTLIPIIGLVIALVIFVWKYDLTEERVASMIAEMKEKGMIEEQLD
jgi:sugar (glycoside-pentoside-hexuronide) transporter